MGNGQITEYKEVRRNVVKWVNLAEDRDMFVCAVGTSVDLGVV
jgi:hypothetical protein